MQIQLTLYCVGIEKLNEIRIKLPKRIKKANAHKDN